MKKESKASGKRKMFAGGLVIILLAVLFSFGYRRINHKYPEAVTEAVGMGEPIEADGLQFLARNAHFYTYEELKERKDIPEEAFDMEGMCLITFDVELKNVSEEVKTVESAYRRLETIGCSNGVNMGFYRFFNPDSPRSVFELASDETKAYTLTYTLVPPLFKEKEWEEIEDRKFEYVLSLYPVKKVIQLSYS